MYSMSNIRAQLSEQLPIVQTVATPKPSGLLMRRAKELLEERPVSYNPAESILNHIKKYQETATLEGGIDTQSVETLEVTRPAERPYEIPSGGSREDFISRLVMSESSNNPNAEVTIKDGRTFVGFGQFGEARLADFKKATGLDFTQEEFKKDEGLQRQVMDWHLREIDKVISKVDPEGSYNRDGLRAVAHLGGIGGMKRYVSTSGKYNPEDEFGTSLQDYYSKFSE